MHPVIKEALVGHMERLKAANEALGAMLRQQQEQQQVAADPAKEKENAQRKKAVAVAKMTQRLVSQIQVALNALERIAEERAALESKLTEIIDDEETRESIADPKYQRRIDVIRDVLEQVAATLPGFVETPTGDQPDEQSGAAVTKEPSPSTDGGEIVLGSEAKG